MIQDFTLVHIGKCGGTTARDTFRDNNIKFKRKHLCEIQYDPNEKYVLLLRNPIKRFISAFNWRKHLVNTDDYQKRRFYGEEQLLNAFEAVNSLAESIYDKDGNQVIDFSKYYIHHLKEDMHFYIGEFLKKCNSDSYVKVILTETIHEDIKNLFGIDVTTHGKNNKNKYDCYLTDLGYKNLKKCLIKDYQCIDRLFDLNFISKNQYRILSK